MAIDPVAEKIGALTEAVKNVNSKLDSADESRKGLWEQLRGIQNTLIDVTSRQSRTDELLELLRPQVQEFSDYKLKAQGAGLMGRWLWIAGGGLIAGASWVYNHLVFK